MLQNKRKLIVISLITAIVILIALILIMYFWPKNKVSVENPPNGQNIETGAQGQLDLNPSSPQRIKEESSYPLGLKQLAMSFAERYGSYSSDVDFKNFNDLEPLATNSMIDKMKKIANDDNLAKSTSTEIFQGFTSKALSAELGLVEKSKATVLVNTQRLTYLGSGKEPNISYRKISINFLKVGNEWKVDDANWQ